MVVFGHTEGRVDVLEAKADVGRCRVEVWTGDLTTQDVDAIVNAANSRLAHAGGLAGAIVRRGGQVIQQESHVKAPCAVGGATVTGAGRLRCRHVIHAVGPRWGEGDEEAKLRSAVNSAFMRAEELGLVSLALPAISTGIFGYPKDAGCSVIVEEVLSRLREAGTVSLVRLVSVDKETTGYFCKALQTIC